MPTGERVQILVNQPPEASIVGTVRLRVTGRQSVRARQADRPVRKRSGVLSPTADTSDKFQYKPVILIKNKVNIVGKGRITDHSIADMCAKIVFPTILEQKKYLDEIYLFLLLTRKSTAIFFFYKMLE